MYPGNQPFLKYPSWVYANIGSFLLNYFTLNPNPVYDPAAVVLLGYVETDVEYVPKVPPFTPTDIVFPNKDDYNIEVDAAISDLTVVFH